ncbi:hypothetical protein CLV88_101703 [Shimia abyssi]|uniref:DUF1127 domain-containing protein n=1 Tax=Shimia abyssi TaxID=1662395 RepID=A0A2P8FKM6_9RHOB|nr:hypothetical protein CLV88_101703 [Shimia abyssi]
MPDTLTAPRRARYSFAQILPRPTQSLRLIWQFFTSRLTDPRQFYPHLSDRQARDVGLSSADLEVRRLRLPSRHTHHPRL